MNKFKHQTSFWNCKGTEISSQGISVEKNTHGQRVQLRRILLTSEARWWNLSVWLKSCIRAIYMSHLEEQSRSKAPSCSRLSGREAVTGKNSLMLSTCFFRIKWVVNCLGNSRQEIDGRSCGLFLQTSVCSFTRRTRYEQQITKSLYYRGKVTDKHWCFIENNANIPNSVSVSYHSLATQFNMLSICFPFFGLELTGNSLTSWCGQGK